MKAVADPSGPYLRETPPKGFKIKGTKNDSIGSSKNRGYDSGNGNRGSKGAG
jgi:hypothetical protein